jgi:hypothetical protein
VSFGFIGFIRGQFMLRYIALDVVGLIAALSVLTSFSDSQPMKRFVTIFQILRLGDLSLLAAILLINYYAGTLNISQMISSALEMPLSAQMWVFWTFLFAILIKLAIWPFDLWLRSVRESEVGVSFWVSGLLMPSLGYYLLYRIMPIIASQDLFKYLTLLTSLGLLLVYFVFISLRLVKAERFTLVNGVFGCFLLGAVSFGAAPYLLYYLLGLISLRLVIALSGEKDVAGDAKWLIALAMILNVLFIFINFNHYPILFSLGWLMLTAFSGFWIKKQLSKTASETIELSSGLDKFSEILSNGSLSKSAQWLNRVLEIDLFTSGFSQISSHFLKLAEWFSNHIERRLDRGWAWVGEKLMLLSQGALNTLEVDPAIKTGELVNGAMKSLEAHEENVLKKTLRLDLAWIPFLLAVILILLFVF